MVRLLGRLACKSYEGMRREAAALKIQKNVHRYQARTAYKRLQVSVLVLQTGVRAMDARKKFRFRKQTKAATIVQVGTFLMTHALEDSYLFEQRYQINASFDRPSGVAIELLHTIQSLEEEQ